MIYKKIDGKFEEYSLLNKEEFEISLISLSFVQRENVYVEWIFEIKKEEDQLFKTIYSAWANQELTKNNFSVIGISKESLPLVIFAPETIKGRKVLVKVENNEVVFNRCLTEEEIIVSEVAIPF